MQYIKIMNGERVLPNSQTTRGEFKYDDQGSMFDKINIQLTENNKIEEKITSLQASNLVAKLRRDSIC